MSNLVHKNLSNLNKVIEKKTNNYHLDNLKIIYHKLATTSRVNEKVKYWFLEKSAWVTAQLHYDMTSINIVFYRNQIHMNVS